MQLLREKSRTYCGLFKILLSKVKLEDIPENQRQFGSRDAARLQKSFDLTWCIKIEPDHYVFALMFRANLPRGLQKYGNPFEEPQHFDPPQLLTCIDGEHRLEAIDQFLAGKDRWWVASKMH